MLPKIRIVIALEPRHEFDGEIEEASISQINANLPSSCFDIEVTESNVSIDDGFVTVTDNLHHTAGEVPFEVYGSWVNTGSPAESGAFSNSPGRWEITYQLGDSRGSALILEAASVEIALSRFREHLPQASIGNINQVFSQRYNHPLEWLEDFTLVLPVGGPPMERIPQAIED